MPVWVQFDGLVTVGRETYGSMGRIFAGPWARTKARKNTLCYMSGAEIKKGVQVYKPITNGMERMQRVLASVMEDQAAADKRLGIEPPVYSNRGNIVLDK